MMIPFGRINLLLTNGYCSKCTFPTVLGDDNSLLLSPELEHALIFPFIRNKYIFNASCGLVFPHIPVSMFLHVPLLKATNLIGLVTIHDSFTSEDISSTLPEETTTLKQLFRAQ